MQQISIRFYLLPGKCLQAYFLYLPGMPSTVVADMKYNVLDETLRVRFVSGLIYEYKKVPLEVFKAMKKAHSKGTFLNQHIKGNYDFKKIQ